MAEKNNIVSFDLETTSLGRTSKIVQLSIYNPLKNKYGNIKLCPIIDEKFRKRLTQYDIWQPENADDKTPFYRKVEDKAFEVHGLNNEMLLNERAFSVVAEKIVSNLKDVDYVLTMNGLFFDRPILENEVREFSEKLYTQTLDIKWLDIYRIHLHFNKRVDTLEDMVNLYIGEDGLSDIDFNNGDDKKVVCKLLLDELIKFALKEDIIKKEECTTHIDFIYNVLDFDTKMSLDTIPLKIHHKINGNKLSDLYLKYTGKVLEDAHDAEVDARATYEIYEVMKEVYNITDEDAYEITNNTTYSDFINLGNLKNIGNFETPEIVMNFGKFKEKPLEVLFNNEDGINYHKWIQNGDFDVYFKRFLKTQEILFNESKNNNG